MGVSGLYSQSFIVAREAALAVLAEQDVREPLFPKGVEVIEQLLGQHNHK